MSNTAAPTTAPAGSLTFADNTTGLTTNAVSQYMSETTIIQPDGSLTAYISLKLATPGNFTSKIDGAITTTLSFVNVMVYTKINGVTKTLEVRKTKNELKDYFDLASSDSSNPKNEFIQRNSSGIITHIKFRFDNVLLPLPNNEGLPNETLGVNAYEQNNFGNNFSVGYQNTQIQGLTFSVSQNPGKPTLTYAPGSTGIYISSNGITVGNDAGKLAATAALRINFSSRIGGPALRTYNIYMQVESTSFNGVVAQLLNIPIVNSNPLLPLTYIDIPSGSLYYNAINDMDIVSFTASVDNTGFNESGLSDPLSSVATLKSAVPVIVSVKNAEILTPFNSSYTGPNDNPGVRFSFTANAAEKWVFISVWCRPATAAGVDNPLLFRMAQMWSRNANSNDINTQLATNGSCELVWNQKFITTVATNTTNSLGVILPCMTAFDIYLILSENADIAVTGATLVDSSSTTGNALQGRQSQSNSSPVQRVVTSIFRPPQVIISTLSAVTSLDTVLTLTNLYNSGNSSTMMPSSHLVPYFTVNASQTLSSRMTLKASNFVHNIGSIPAGQTGYDGSVTPNSFNAKNIPLTPNVVIPTNNFSLTNSTAVSSEQWFPNYEYVIKNILLLPVSQSVVEVLNILSDTTVPGSNPPMKEFDNTKIVQIGSSTVKSLNFYEFLSITPIRSKPIASTPLPTVYISKVHESRLWISGAAVGTTAATFGATQFATYLQASQSYDSVTSPYKWTQLEIVVSADSGTALLPGTSNATKATLTSAAALQSEILYLANNVGVDMVNTVIVPQPGNVGAAGTTGNFPSFPPSSSYYVRLRLLYTWNGAGGAAADSFYPGPWFGGVPPLNDTTNNDAFLVNVSATPPPPVITGLVVSRVRALKLSVQVLQPEPVINIATGVKYTYTGVRFQVVDALNNPVSWGPHKLAAGTSPGILNHHQSQKFVGYIAGNVQGTQILEFFNIPPSHLDNSYSVLAYAEYLDSNTTAKVSSVPARSPDIYFEKVPNVHNLVLTERSDSVHIAAYIDLGVNDMVPVNASTSAPHLGDPLASNLYPNKGMYLTCLVPALVGGQEQFSHNLTWHPSTQSYQTSVLAKIPNSDVYGNKTNFILIAANNTGVALAMYPNQNILPGRNTSYSGFNINNDYSGLYLTN